MENSHGLAVIKKYVNEEDFPVIKKVSLQYKDIFYLKLVSLLGKKVYRRYFLKVTYKTNTRELIRIDNTDKDEIKKSITNFNFWLNML